jgi:hypothetical protein
MSQLLRKQDWEHRLHVLSAWRTWNHDVIPDCDNGATYRAVLDGCAVTVRALCRSIGVECNFKEATQSNSLNRLEWLLRFCTRGKDRVHALSQDNQRCLLEVLYLGNRAVAHPEDGDLDHRVRQSEMTIAINTVLDWLASEKSKWPGLQAIPDTFFEHV